MDVKKFLEFLIESSSNLSIPRDLVWITVRYLVKNSFPLGKKIYMSVYDREMIKREWKEKLPSGFPGPDKSITVGKILTPLLVDEPPDWRNEIYTDNDDIVKGDKTLYRIEKDDTWKDLGVFLSSEDSLLKNWLNTTASLEDFKHANRGAISGKLFGL